MLRHALVLALVAAAPLGAQQPSVYTPNALNANQRLAREIYKELIEMNTGVTTGNVTQAAVAMAKRFRDAGIPEADIFVGGPRPDKHNVVARIRGRSAGGRKPLLLLAHLDVVEALKADWSPDLDPFVFTERDGYYYGRGTADDKAMASIFVANVFRLKKEGWVPDRDVIIALTADEESGPANGVDWLLKTHPELVDAALVINEGGGGTLRNGKPLFNSVQATEKITTNITLRATNRGGHSSVPRADNAITSLADALAKVGRYKFSVKLNDVTRAFFTKTADLETPKLGRAMKTLVANPSNAAAAAVVSNDPRYSAMLRTTCVATMVDGGHAHNALPQRVTVNVNCRMFPGRTSDETQAELARVIGNPAITIEQDVKGKPIAKAPPLNPAIIGPMEQLSAKFFPGVPVIPTISTGATDGVFMGAVGIPTYGVPGIWSDSKLNNIHGLNEHMEVRSLYEGRDYLYALVKLLSSK